MTSLHSCTSDGSGTLAHMLTIAIYDYVRKFGREPRLMLIPYFRRDELAACVGPLYPLTADFGSNGENTFRGVPFWFSTSNDAIELRGSL